MRHGPNLHPSRSPNLNPNPQDLSSYVTVILNDKLKADRDKDKKKPKGKAAKKVNVSAGKAQDLDDGYDDGYGDYY
jgi:hypothetical protein